jgi:glycine cleavage system H lipoate-binding protein
MKLDPRDDKEIYYTNDHEWIDFQGMVAYSGICAFKLTGFKDIQQINFHQALGAKKQGDSIATIHYHDYPIDVHMPVDGKVIEINEKLAGQDKQKLLQDPEGRGWIALIIPATPGSRKGLIMSRDYHSRISLRINKY